MILRRDATSSRRAKENVTVTRSHGKSLIIYPVTVYR